MNKYWYLSLLFAILSLKAQANTLSNTENGFTLMPGFKMNVFAEIPKARSLCQSPSGTIFVGSRSGNKVHALQDLDKDGIAEKQYVISSGHQSPNGVAFKDGDLYIAEISRILILRDIENQLDNPPKPEVFYDQYPKDTHHGWKYIAFGPDGWLYVPVGAPCNICLQDDPVYASITRLSPDGKTMEVFASGIRNSVGLTWHPETGDLWFTDNGRDNMGDNIPPDELNRAYQKGLNFGYPFCHGGDIQDPEFGRQGPCSFFEKPVQKLGPHVASLGLKFCNSSQFPKRPIRVIFSLQNMGHGTGLTRLGMNLQG